MTLTPEQARLLQTGTAVPMTIDQLPCVLVRQDVFEKLQSVEYDDSDWTSEELAMLAARTFAAIDADESAAMEDDRGQ